MRRILFPLLVIGLAAGLFSLGSGAFFSDTEEDTGNTITAGTLDLEANANGTTSCSIAAYAPVGGDVDFDGPAEECVSAVQNDGTITGDLWVRIVITNHDNGCVEPETAAGDGTCGPAGGGELGSQLDVSACTEVATAGTEAGTPCTGVVKLNDFEFACAKVVDDFTAGAIYTLTLDLTDANVTNLSQSDSVTIDFYYVLLQVDQAANATCTGPA